METPKRPTISIKNHLNGQINQKQPTKAAINGILKRGNSYWFTTRKHEEILEILEQVKTKIGMNGRQFSMALGYGDTAYKSWLSGARFSKKSYTQVMQKASELREQHNAKQLKLPIQDSPTMTDEQMAEYLMKKGWKLNVDSMIAHLKDLGYKIQKPITTITYEEI